MSDPHAPHVPEDEPTRIRALLADVGVPGLVDIHTHFMPDNVLRKVWNYFDHAEEVTGRPWPITYRWPEAGRVDYLERCGVQAFTSLNYPHRPDMAEWLNAWSTEFAATTPRCVHSATFYPEPSAARYVPEAIEAGARIFKAHVQVGAYDPNDPLLDPVWSTLSESGTPLVIHSGSGPRPGEFTGPAGMRTLLERFPHLTLVIAHMGMPDYLDFLDIAEQHENVHLDTTMAFTRFTESAAPFPREALDRLEKLGSKVVFGSDFPNIPYPYADAIEACLALRLSPAWNRAVLHDNGARLLGLQG